MCNFRVQYKQSIEKKEFGTYFYFHVERGKHKTKRNAFLQWIMRINCIKFVFFTSFTCSFFASVM